MNRLAVLASVVVAGMMAAGLSAQQAPPGPGEIEQVADNVYKIFGGGGNTIVFVRGDGVALVDTKLAGNGEAILDRVRQVTSKPVTLIINTHSHGDHLGSNAEIGGHASVAVIAHANTARSMAALTEPLPVTESFDDRLTLGSGADRIDLYWFGAGHTDGDAFVVFPAARTMAAGDIYQLQAMPRIDRASGGSALALPVTLTQALYGIKGVDTVIDGHGDRVRSWEEFRSYVTFTRAVVQAARQTQRMGGTPEQALASLERNPGFLLFLDDTAQPAVAAGNTPKGRALTALATAFAELSGE